MNRGAYKYGSVLGEGVYKFCKGFKNRNVKITVPRVLLVGNLYHVINNSMLYFHTEFYTI